MRPYIDDFNLYYGGKALARASGARTRVRRQGTMLTSHPSEEIGAGRSPLEIRLLGPLELLVDGEPRAVRALGERALLARLATSPGQVVSRDRLIDELWEESLPADPPNALQLRVAKLRRLVGGAEALVTEPPGYRLEVGEDQVDASRFARLITDRRFDQALALWRGPPYGELADRGWARAEAGRLAELRASALEQLALDWAREHAGDRPDAALRLAGALGWYWYVGRQTDGRRQLQTTLAAATGGSPAARARALQALSLAARPAGCIVHPSGEAAEAARASLELFSEDEPVRAALSRLLLAVEGVAGGDVPAWLAEVKGGRAVLHAHDDAWGVGLADLIEMEIRLHSGPVGDALMFGERAASAFDALEDDWGRSAVRLHLGHGLRLAGRIDEARSVLSVAVERSRRAGLPNNLARAYVELGEAALHVGSAQEAESWLARAELVAREVASETLLALVRLGRGAAARWRAETDPARAHYQGALAICLVGETTRVEARARTGIAAADLDDGEGERAAAELARALRLGRQIGDPSIAAVALEQLARLAAARGDDAGRARLLDDAERIRAERRRPRSALEQRDVQAAPVAVAQD